jgi:hypothetical protein
MIMPSGERVLRERAMATGGAYCASWTYSR